MDIRFYLDPETDQPHIYEHGVTEEEVKTGAFSTRGRSPGSEESRVAIGQTADGRYLKVIYVRDAVGDGVLVITAYDLQGKPLKAYRRRQRRRGK